MSIVEVRPLPTEKWHGKKGREAFSQAKTIQVLYNHKTGKYDTGLTEQEAEEWGRELGIDLSDRFVPDQEHPFWSTKAAQIRLENNTMFFNTENKYELIKIKNMRASKFIANSMKEWEENKWPDALYVIFDETAEADVKASKIQRRKRAIILADKMTPAEKAAMVLILGGKYVKNKSNNFVDVELDELMEEDDKLDEFLNYAQMDTADLMVRGQVLEALHRQVLHKEGNSVYYMGERIGFDLNEAVDWFKSPDNQKLKINILEKIN